MGAPAAGTHLWRGQRSQVLEAEGAALRRQGVQDGLDAGSLDVGQAAHLLAGGGGKGVGSAGAVQRREGSQERAAAVRLVN